MKAMVSVLFLLALVTGCARHTSTDPSASPSIKDKAACESAGGKWNGLLHHCKMS